MKFKHRRLVFQYNPGIRLISWMKRIRFSNNENVSLYRIVKIFFQNLNEDEILDRANGVAFNFILAIFPTIIVVFTLVPYITTFFPELNTETIMEFIGDAIPKSMYEAMRTIIEEILERKQGGLLSFGLIFALYLSTNGMMALMRAFNACYRTIDSRGALKTRLIATALTLTMAVALFLAVVLLIVGQLTLEYILEHLPEYSWLDIDSFTIYLLFASRFLAIFLAFFLSISCIYYFGPAIHYNWRFFSMGSITATLLCLAVMYGFSFYITNFGTYNKVYGSIGALIALMILIQLITIVLLIGYEVNISIHDAIRKQALWNSRMHRLRRTAPNA
ncbi:YihY/virulence factor BrkB family protein [Chryseolinea sp. T2]|uniref:YihY/virulence factor BrkB family protein n=1 Tax=Chryseolinea sp. T2 TaxID=3129255 RepID=UPI0030777490